MLAIIEWTKVIVIIISQWKKKERQCLKGTRFAVGITICRHDRGDVFDGKGALYFISKFDTYHGNPIALTDPHIWCLYLRYYMCKKQDENFPFAKNLKSYHHHQWCWPWQWSYQPRWWRTGFPPEQCCHPPPDQWSQYNLLSWTGWLLPWHWYQSLHLFENKEIFTSIRPRITIYNYWRLQ